MPGLDTTNDTWILLVGGTMISAKTDENKSWTQNSDRPFCPRLVNIARNLRARRLGKTTRATSCKESGAESGSVTAGAELEMGETAASR